MLKELMQLQQKLGAAPQQARLSKELALQLKIVLSHKLFNNCEVITFFEFISSCKENGLIDSVAILFIFEELFERANQENLEAYFELFSKYIEQNGLCEDNTLIFSESCSSCARMCKNIIRRLSSSRDIAFKSRIQRVLSMILPINHKYGLNRQGKINSNKNW